MNTKLNINETIHAPIISRFAPFHMQDSGQCSINTEASASLQLYVSMKDLYARVIQIRIL